MGGVGPRQPCLSCLRSLAGARDFEVLSGDSEASELLRNWLEKLSALDESSPEHCLHQELLEMGASC